MNKKTLLFSIMVLLLFAGSTMGQNLVRATQTGSQIDVTINGRLFTSYIISSEEKYPFFYPVNGPSFASVTSMRNANFPHHSSLFFGCDHVNGGNYWQEGLDRGQIISLRADILESDGERVVIENECIWTRPGANAPVKDFRRIDISAPSENIYQIDFDITMEMLEDVTIRRTNHSLFSGRMDPDLAVVNGGVMINAEGEQSESGTFGKPSAWISCYGNRMGKSEGMTIMQHPSNEWYPSPWFTRDYGFFSPTPMYWPEDIQGGTFIEKGRQVRLRYRVLVHAGDHEEVEIARLFKEYSSDFLSEIGVVTSVDNHEIVKDAGYTFIEGNVQQLLVPLEPHAVFLENLKKISESSLPVPVLANFIPGNLKSVGPEADHSAVIAYADTAFRRAAMAGVEIIVFGSGVSRRIPDGFDHDKAIGQFVSLLKQMGPMAKEHGIYVAVEPLNRREVNFINNMVEGLDIVKMVNHPNIKLLCDFYHMLREDEPAEHIIHAAGYIKHVHIAEKENRTPPGVEGDDFSPYIDALREIGYEGMISVEARWMDDFEGLMPGAIRAIKKQIH